MINMPGENKAFDFSLAKADSKTIPSLRTSRPPVAKQEFVLDMGEASREEGFRLYGCR